MKNNKILGKIFRFHWALVTIISVTFFVTFGIVWAATSVPWVGPTAPPPGNSAPPPIFNSNFVAGAQDAKINIANPGDITAAGTADVGILTVRGDSWVNGTLNVNKICFPGNDCKVGWPTGGDSLWTLATNGTDIYRSTGNVGIGTNNPGSQLEIKGAGTGKVGIGQWTGSNAYAGLGLAGSLAGGNYNFLSSPGDTNLYINRPTGRYIYFRENNNDQMTIASDGTGGGNVGINNTTPKTYLDIKITKALADPLPPIMSPTRPFRSAGYPGIIVNDGPDKVSRIEFLGANSSGVIGHVDSSSRFSDVNDTVGLLVIDNTHPAGAGIMISASSATFGNVGIGSNNVTTASLDVRKTSVSTFNLPSIAVSNAGDGYLMLVGQPDPALGPAVIWDSDNALRFGTSANNLGALTPTGPWSEKMRITNDGKVGIGNNAPTAALDVQGSKLLRVGDMYLNSNSANYLNSYQRFSMGYGIYWNDITNKYQVVDPTYNQATFSDENGKFVWTAHDGALSSPQTYSQWHAYDRLTILPNGNVGIGATSPTASLDVRTPSANTFNLPSMAVSKAGDGYLMLVGQPDPALGPAVIWDPDNALRFGTSANNLGALTPTGPWSEKMRITSGGNVGIGTPSPGEKLTVNGRLAFTLNGTDEGNSAKLDYRSFDANAFSIVGAGASNRVIRLFDSVVLGYNGNQSPGSGSMIISGNVGIGTPSPANKLQSEAGSANIWAGAFNSTSNSPYLGIYARGSTYAGYFGGPVYVSGNVTIGGNLQVSGTKNFIQDDPADPTKQIVYYSLEGGESGTYTRGSGQLVNGEATINLPEHFGLVTSDQDITVQITPTAQTNGLYVASKSNKQVVVKELGQSKGSATFDYLVQGVRKGYENSPVIVDKVKTNELLTLPDDTASTTASAKVPPPPTLDQNSAPANVAAAADQVATPPTAASTSGFWQRVGQFFTHLFGG